MKNCLISKEKKLLIMLRIKFMEKGMNSQRKIKKYSFIALSLLLISKIIYLKRVNLVLLIKKSLKILRFLFIITRSIIDNSDAFSPMIIVDPITYKLYRAISNKIIL